MKNITMGGILFALLIITAALAACVQAPVKDPSGDTVIKYKFYGGYVMQTHAIQELVVTKDKATFTIMAADGNITEKFEKALTMEQFNAIVKVFGDNNFSTFGDRYDEGQNHVADVGFTNITLTTNGTTKTVTTDNFNRYLPAGLVSIREKLQETVVFTRALNEKQVREIADAWIRDAPTYRYDGSALEFVNYSLQESNPVTHVLTYRFTSSHTGYGNRSGMVTAQVITRHTIKITIVESNVESALIDEKWDEQGQFISGSELSLSYQPKQCERTVWQVWEANSGRVYIRMPTEEEIIRHYYAAVYETDVRDVKKIQSDMMTCQACDVCPDSYRLGLTVNASEMQPLLDEGWTREA
jgi:opacity protein-like surface antigen